MRFPAVKVKGPKAGSRGCAPSGQQIPARLANPRGGATRNASFRTPVEDLLPEGEAAMADGLNTLQALQCFAATRECMIFSLEWGA
ncbi:hypothetical protein GQY15_19915 [Rhodobacter sphaeroides]|uniref:hypothetical protein n=1 Tax=Cereibacter sphaeroides TaxID=1063 RepID=UPI001321DC65|nr:hypothetical protein [Cereibacter sphaeroides]MWP39831.1 hypothetical protein [Cereibacter sphaeroides]